MSIKTGLQNFLERGDKLAGSRAGLVTHPAAVLPDMRQSQMPHSRLPQSQMPHVLDALLSAGVNITALFGPEHGFWGFEADALKIAHAVEPKTGLPAYSLYGDHLAPSAEMLENVDVLIFDMQDVGVRFYTYISTLFHVLKAAKLHSKRVLVLDRPNPLGVVDVTGPLVERGYESFVGIASLPILHGMTMGELAGWMNARRDIQAALEVVPMQGWQRGMRFAETGLPWVPTSPGIPHLATAQVYPATCLMEGANLSEGRGTALPFEVIGAPWLDGDALAAALNAAELPGVLFRPTVFKPLESKWAGQVCQGVQVHIRAIDVFQPLLTGLHLMRCLIDLGCDFAFLETSWEGTHPHFDLLMGNSRVRGQLLGGMSAADIARSWEADETSFREERAKFLIYN